MKNNIMNDKRIKMSLLCAGMVIVGVVIGYLVGNSKEIPTISNGDEIVASLKGKDFTANDLYSELKANNGGTNTLASLVDAYIADKETDKNDIQDAEDYADSYIENLKSQYESYSESFDDALKDAGYDSVDKFKKVVVKDQLKTIVSDKYIKENMITDDEINKYYDESVEGKMNVQYILVQPDNNDDMSDDDKKNAEAAALKEANEVIEKLQKGGDFTKLAKEHSDDSSTASDGGKLEGFEKSSVVSEFWDAAVALKDGEYTTEPVSSSYGYFVILRKSQDKKPSLKDAKKDILTSLLETKKKDDENISTKAWLKIREQHGLKIVDSEIKKAYEKVAESYK